MKSDELAAKKEELVAPTDAPVGQPEVPLPTPLPITPREQRGSESSRSSSQSRQSSSSGEAQIVDVSGIDVSGKKPIRAQLPRPKKTVATTGVGNLGFATEQDREVLAHIRDLKKFAKENSRKTSVELSHKPQPVGPKRNEGQVPTRESSEVDQNEFTQPKTGKKKQNETLKQLVGSLTMSSSSTTTDEQKNRESRLSSMSSNPKHGREAEPPVTLPTFTSQLPTGNFGHLKATSPKDSVVTNEVGPTSNSDNPPAVLSTTRVLPNIEKRVQKIVEQLDGRNDGEVTTIFIARRVLAKVGFTKRQLSELFTEPQMMATSGDLSAEVKQITISNQVLAQRLEAMLTEDLDKLELLEAIDLSAPGGPIRCVVDKEVREYSQLKKCSVSPMWWWVWDCCLILSMEAFFVLGSYCAVVWREKESFWMNYVFWVVEVVWVADIALRCFKPVRDSRSGQVIDNVLHLFAAKPWAFLIDFLVVIPVDIVLYWTLKNDHSSSDTQYILLLVTRGLRQLKLYRLFLCFEALDLGAIVTSVGVFFHTIGRPVIWYAACTSMIGHVCGLVWHYVASDTNPELCYARSLAEAASLLLGSGPPVSIETTSQQAVAVVLMLVGIGLQVWIVSWAALLVFDWQESSRTAKDVPNLIKCMEHFNVPKDIQHNILTFRAHTFHDDLARQLRALRHLPWSLQQDVIIHMRLVAIASVPLFASVEFECQLMLAYSLRNVISKPNVDIITSGDEATEMFFIAHGYCTVITPQNEEVAKLSRGDYFGENALFSQQRPVYRVATVRALTMCDLWMLDWDSFNGAVKSFASLKEKATDLGIDFTQITSLSSGTQSIEREGQVDSANEQLSSGSSDNQQKILVSAMAVIGSYVAFNEQHASSDRTWSLSSSTPTRNSSSAPRNSSSISDRIPQVLLLSAVDEMGTVESGNFDPPMETDTRRFGMDPSTTFSLFPGATSALQMNSNLQMSASGSAYDNSFVGEMRELQGGGRAKMSDAKLSRKTTMFSPLVGKGEAMFDPQGSPMTIRRAEFVEYLKLTERRVREMRGAMEELHGAVSDLDKVLPAVKEKR